MKGEEGSGWESILRGSDSCDFLSSLVNTASLL